MKLRTNMVLWLKTSQATVNYLHMLVSSRTFYQVTKILGARMSLKSHFLHSHLNFFPSNMGKISDNHGERFYRDIDEIENRCQGRITRNTLADNCWFLQRESDTV